MHSLFHFIGVEGYRTVLIHPPAYSSVNSVKGEKIHSCCSIRIIIVSFMEKTEWEMREEPSTLVSHLPHTQSKTQLTGLQAGKNLTLMVAV